MCKFLSFAQSLQAFFIAFAVSVITEEYSWVLMLALCLNYAWISLPGKCSTFAYSLLAFCYFFNVNQILLTLYRKSNIVNFLCCFLAGILLVYFWFLAKNNSRSLITLLEKCLPYLLEFCDHLASFTLEERSPFIHSLLGFCNNIVGSILTKHYNCVSVLVLRWKLVCII